MSHFSDAIRLPSAKFPEIGDFVVGTVVEIGRSDVPDFDKDGRPSGVKTNEAGEVIQQVDVTLENDGAKIVLHTYGAIFYAIGRALAEIGADDLELGDQLTVSYTGNGEQKRKGFNAPKQYSATIQKI